MSAPISIAVDAMGGDHGVEAAIPGTALIHKKQPHVRFTFYGDENAIRPVLSKYKSLEAHSTVFHTDKMIKNEDKPSVSLRNSKGTSMRLAIEAVHNKEADAVVSAGNTGALMAMAKMVLKTLEGIHRPAIASVFPTLKGQTIMLDLGANVLVDAQNLVQFAVLGSVFAKAHLNGTQPSVGLLNVGTEDSKGPDHVRAAAKILKNIDFPGNYYGFVEGDDITKGTVDVIVSDGYAGNIALKAAEGVGKLTAGLLKEIYTSNPLAMILGGLNYLPLSRLKAKVDPRRHNGGVFLGLNGVCIKSHGGCDALAFSSALNLATELAVHGYVRRVSEEIDHLMSQDSLLLDEGAYQR